MSKSQVSAKGEVRLSYFVGGWGWPSDRFFQPRSLSGSSCHCMDTRSIQAIFSSRVPFYHTVPTSPKHHTLLAGLYEGYFICYTLSDTDRLDTEVAVLSVLEVLLVQDQFERIYSSTQLLPQQPRPIKAQVRWLRRLDLHDNSKT